MSLLNFLKPKWQHKDPQVRISAINSPEGLNQDQLGELLLVEEDSAVRMAALSHLDDWGYLEQFNKKVTNESCIEEIQARIDALKVSAVLSATDRDAKENALKEVSRDDLLLEIIAQDSLKELRILAAEKISSEENLTTLVKSNCGKEISLNAVTRIDDTSLLEEISAKASNRAARVLALKKLNTISEDTALAQKEYFDSQTVDFLERIKVLPMLADIEGAQQQSIEIQKEWNELGVPGQHASVEVFTRYVKEIQNRYDLYLSQSDEERLKQARLPGLLEKLTSIDTQIVQESQNTAKSAHATYETLKNSWQETASEIDEVPKQSLKRFTQSCRQFDDNQAIISKEKVKRKNLESELISVQSTISVDTIGAAQKQFTQVQKCLKDWQPICIEKAPLIDLAKQIEFVIADILTQKREKKVQAIADALKHRHELLLEIEGIIGSEDIKAAEKQFIVLKDRWQKKDATPPDNLQPLDDKFKQLCLDFIHYQKQTYENKDWLFWQSKNLKLSLIDEMIKLHDVNDLHLVFKSMKILQDKWKETGPLRHKDNEKLWRKFQTASEKNFARCREFFHKLDLQAEQNAQEKLGLIEQAQSHQNSTDWKKTADFFVRLQQDWKKIGKTPPGKEQALYQSFRDSCDVFFSKRKEHYDLLDAQRQNNLQIKIDLCEKLEKLVTKPDLSKKDKVREFQKQWKTIGPVPRDSEEEIWQRFKAASDTFYAWLDTLKPDNLLKKEELCVEAELLCKELPDFSDDKKTQAFAGQVIDLQKQWKKIGPVPDGQQDAIWNRFHGACDSFFTQRKQFNDSIDKQRPANEELKIEIIAKLKEAVTSNNTDSVKTIIMLQENWKNIGPATKKNDLSIHRQFEHLCNDFFKQRREVYNEMDRIRRDNLKLKEALCVRLEILAGISVPELPSSGKRKTSLTLADQLKLAFEENFILAGDEKDKSRRKKDELSVIIKEWEQIGPVPKEHEYSLEKRYNDAYSKLTK